ncbi:protein SMAX1-LIKE 3 [Brachypodium distachyon]|uniref:Clp R domain-containing protein n=1 Tax=Brachypodium distachyon TaxID=15368 RepID=A0A0Q3ESW2_BRADI|nr:protein SMAX1-LIKE 3 [Brachypodium distachyon]KQJ89372.1 hypothetical protein BRADI_4g25150v3 [Brachypodium distachyon]|eukprot:XP_003576297.1 protein SMAX1-LIKE 3 [Brachypodium distachyon]
MRAVPGCAVQQQALAAEAAAVVRNAVSLARRRGHAQVTPLHVATAMLSSSPAPAAPGPGLLRAACLRSSSHSHPLQCKALELCFNVALNRLPTSFHGHGGSPTAALSNALVAAFKRAQAHHRRGSGESSSPAPVLAGHGGGTKVELEQLVVSILDDPSVSRVMREAGFSSALVKANVAALERESPKPSPPSDHPHPSHYTATSTKKLNNGVGGGGIEDAMKVLECMASGQHRCIVAVSGSGGGHGDDGGSARAERAVKAVMDMVSKAELPQGQNYKQLACVQFVPLSVSSFRAAARGEVDARTGELRGLAREAQRAGKGLVVVVQDLAFAADFWAEAGKRPRAEDYYCPLEHAVMEVSGLVRHGGGRFWMLGFASEAVFSRCRAGRPSLADVWGIHPVVFPGDGGCCSSGGRSAGWPPLVVINGAGEMSPTWPEEPMSIIPPWLRRYHDPNLAAPPSSCGTDLQQLQDLWKPSMCSNGSSAAARHTSELTLSFSSPPSPSPVPAASDHNYYYSKQQPRQLLDPHQQLQLRATATTPSPPESTSAQSSSSGSGVCPLRPRFTELTAESLKTLCGALEGPLAPPRSRDLAPAIASVVLRRRSGVTTQRRRTAAAATWLVFRGDDGDGKKAMAMELARLVFGSYADFACLTISADHSVVGFPSSGEFVPATKTTFKRRRSRSPDDNVRHGCAQSIKLYEALRENPRRVIMVDGAEQLDIDNGCVKEAIANGRMRCSSSVGNVNGNGGDSVGLEDAIVVLSFDDSRPRVKSQRVLIDDEEEGGSGVGMEDGLAKKSPPRFSLDLNACVAGDEEEETGNLVEDDDVEIGDVVDGVFYFQLPRDLSH